jgi:DNA-binding phage protein
MTVLSISLSESGEVSAEGFITEILGFAASRGLDQIKLSGRAGISPETLSRLKKAGSCRLTTALELARAVGFKAINFEDVGDRIATTIAARKLSAGRRLAINAEELVVELSAKQQKDQFKAHLYGFFEELPVESVHDVILEEQLDFVHLASVATELGAEGETVEWLAEMASDNVAYAP